MQLLCAATLILLALCYLGQVDASAYDKILSHSRIRAKKQGPNMCALQEVMGTKKKYFSTCRNWYMGSICGKKAMVLYECCPGYMPLDGMRGCPAAAPIDTVYGTLGVVKADVTKKYSDQCKLREEIQGAGSYTMFAPSDDAWELLDATRKRELQNNAQTLYAALTYHMVNRRLLTKDLKNDMTLESMHNKQGLYINHYSNGIVTVNCARIIHGNQVATNGVVHVIDRVIAPVKNTIKDVIETNEELDSLSTVAREEASFLDKLGEPGHYTFFAPTNKAFEKLNNQVLERVLKDKTVLQAFLKYHLLSSVQCSEAILAGTRFETLEGSFVEIGCDGDSLTVNGIKMVLKKDIVTSNGVIHLIDQVLLPDAAKQVMELVGESQSTFGDMVSEMGLAAAMGSETQYTLLAPLNNVFTDTVMRMDQRLLKFILENHILKLKVTLSDLYNGQLLETLGGKMLRVFVYRTTVCIENACMVRGSKEGSNGALHLMRSLISVPKSSMYELMETDGRFRVFLTLMETAGLTELLRQEGAYTVFAPTDDAFGGLTKEDMALLTSDINTLRTILLYHFTNGIFINGGLENSVTNILTTLQGNNLQLLSVNNSIHVNSVDVPDIDLMASNGVIHVIKTLLYPGDLPVGRQDLLFLLQKLIKHIQMKFVSGYTYKEIPFSFIKKIFTTHIVESGPEIKVIETEPTFTKVTKIIETQPTVTKVVVHGEPQITELTKVIETEPTFTKMTHVIGESSVMRMTKKIESSPTVKEVIIEGEPTITKVKRIIEGDPTITKVRRIIEAPTSSSDGDLDISKRIRDGEAGFTTIVIKPEPRIIEGPDFSKITSLKDNPELIDAESERITKLIKQGGAKRRSAVRRSPGMKRRVRLVRHHKPSQ
ncbi:periostin isoform X2 [Brachyhypopomus gauderio]|uniref:periostin isoform X2 n=1 Tax=Brachyhypopomus gauderio TaxID=698409 RepID=UPI004042AC21